MTGVQAKDIDLLDTVRENFNARRTFKSAIRAVKAMNRLRGHSINTRDDEERRAATTIAAPTAQAQLNKDGGDMLKVKTVQ